mmetsp:Transcript_12442/g.36665  ORF Transcript_12442/g.36665 Transcript_12442/m.36665 type:complete len:111 (+) Transcript_12442:324-656(+)
MCTSEIRVMDPKGGQAWQRRRRKEEIGKACEQDPKAEPKASSSADAVTVENGNVINDVPPIEKRNSFPLVFPPPVIASTRHPTQLITSRKLDTSDYDRGLVGPSDGAVNF